MRTELTHRQVVRQLSAGARKSSQGAPAYSRFVNRPLGRHIAAGAYRLGLVPNQVTAISAVLSASAVALILLVRPTVWSGIATCVLLAAGYAFDSADGQLARLLAMGSPAGEWLDHVVDTIKVSAIHLSVLASFYRWPPTDAVAEGVQLMVPGVYAMVAAVLFTVLLLNDFLRASRGVARTAASSSSLVHSLIVLPTDYGLLPFVFVLWGFGPVFLAMYAALMAANALFLVAGLGRWFHEMKGLP